MVLTTHLNLHFLGDQKDGKKHNQIADQVRAILGIKAADSPASDTQREDLFVCLFVISFPSVLVDHLRNKTLIKYATTLKWFGSGSIIHN